MVVPGTGGIVTSNTHMGFDARTGLVSSNTHKGF
jgi:hypothetical protein